MFVFTFHTPFQWFGVKKEGEKRLKWLEKQMRSQGMEFRPESYKWILSPTASTAILNQFGATEEPNWLWGMYFLNAYFTTAIVVIHQLPRTEETLWLRVLGRRKVQSQAIAELAQLPDNNPFRAMSLKLLYNLEQNLQLQANKSNLNQEDREFIMRLAPLYERDRELAVQQGIEQGLQQGIEQGLQQGIEQGIEQGLQQGLQQGVQQGLQQGLQQGVQQGLQQGLRATIESLLIARFGSLDNSLTAIIEPLATLTPGEFTPLLLNLSREELLERFSTQ